MAFLRTVSALSWLRSTGKHAVRRLQTLSSSDLDLHSHLKELIPELQEMLRNQREGKWALQSLKSHKFNKRWFDMDIRFQGLSFPECLKLLPAAKPGGEPLPEGLLWLLLTGKVPRKEQVDALSNELRSRATVPDYVYKAIDALPDTAHPITQITLGIMALQVQSQFQKACEKGIPISKCWEPAYEDSLNLIACLPSVAAYVYQRIYKGSQFIPMDDSLDYGANFSHMLGFDNPKMHELMRLFLAIHTDREGGGTFSPHSHTSHLVGSAVSDPYLSFAAALNCLAGPLHGLANQEVLLWVKSALNECGENSSIEQLEEYAWKTLKSGKFVPSYGRGLLPKGNPKYTWLREFAVKHLPEDPLFQLVSKLYEVGPPFLTEIKYHQLLRPEKKNPWPNVDAHSGVLLNHFGLTEARYYTALSGISRSIVICSQLLWDIALMFQIGSFVTSNPMIVACAYP